MPAAIPYLKRDIPEVARVRQHLLKDHIKDVRGETRTRLLDAGLRGKIKPGARIAITAGSRGIGGFVEILAGSADAVKAAGGEPFIIPAMGSHGGATPEGQLEILKLLGVSRDSVGAEIRATMETVELGAAENGAVAHLDRLAAECDGIIVMGRTKTHPESAGELASGLLKMVTIGLGKQRGAQEAHNHELWSSVRAVPKLTLGTGKVLFGIAVVENGYRRPVVIEVVPPTYDAFLESDTRLLKVSKSHLATIPFQQLDVLVVDELGKTISGAGMDPNIIGHWRISGGPHIPDFRRIVVLSLTQASLGNGIGIGLADFTTQRFVQAYNPEVSYVNILTATEPDGNTREGPLPLALRSDREAIQVALYSSLAGPQPRLCRIRSTAALDEFWVSTALLPEVHQNPRLTLLEAPHQMEFSEAGNLF